MDTMSLAEAATTLGTSVPRLQRAIDRLGIQVVRGPLGRRLGPDQLRCLRDQLGFVPQVDGLSREAVLVLAALDRRPFGVRSVRALARAAGISPTVAARLVRELSQTGLIEQAQVCVAEGAAREATVLRLNRSHRRWSEVRSAIRKADPPRCGAPVPPRRVPPRLWHHFWNAVPSDLQLPNNADYVAARLLRTDDPEAISWAGTNLGSPSVRKVAGLRALSKRDRAWLQEVADQRATEGRPGEASRTATGVDRS